MRYLVDYFSRFRTFIGKKIYVLMALILAAGFLEGIGVTLFFPILQDGFGDDKISRALKFSFGLFGLDYSFKIILLFIMIFFILRAVFLLLYDRYFGKVSSNLVVYLRRTVMEKIFNTDYLYILKKEVGFVNNAITREIALVVDAFRTFSYVLNYVFFSCIYISLAMLLNFKAALITLGLAPVFILVMKRLNTLTNEASVGTSLSYGRYHSILIQALGKLKYVKATLANIRISRIIDKENIQLGKLRFKLTFLQSMGKNLLEPLMVFVVVWLFFYNVVVMQRSVNEIIFMVFLFLQVARQFLSVQTSYRKFLASMGSINTFKHLLKELDENTEELNAEGASPDFSEAISLEKISLRFPNGKVGLDAVNITIRPKTTVALVGHSGSGKSTVANMVTGLMRPTTGRIRFGQTDYADINLRALRENIGYVTQEDIIFNASIRDNITLWSDEVDERRLEKVIETARISDFVKGIPEGDRAMLGDNGLDISGGQRQRVTIARELYKDAKLLILDEATSSLDSKSEKIIYENLRQYKGLKTMLVIAHRLSTIKNADYIYVLDEGRVIEEGSYDQLVGKRGEFKNMISEQALVEAGREKV